ncbi:MAG: FecR domain-containing protein [Acidobacteriaceae bacterium]|nr:FecR domain-containing protein [Acidobacteriaceae bacterium]
MKPMGRNMIALVLAVLLTIPSVNSLRAQDQVSPDPNPQYQQYPQTQQYPPAQQYPQAQQYPDSQQYPQAQQAPGQESAGQDEAADRQRGVARLSIAQGDVNVKRGDSGDLVAAVVNAPLFAQDHVQTSPGSRAEIELDYANVIRLAPNTDVGFADLEYHRYQVQLGEGTIIFRVLRDSDAQTEIDTPSVGLRPTQKGDYRISVLDDGSTQIAVRSGELEVSSPRGTQQLQAGRTMLVRGDSSDPEFQMTSELAPDQFDDWSANRDRQLLASKSYSHVSRDIYGADDLDQYGNWVPSQYGNVWEPQNQGSDWAPYSNGQWTDEPYYGWTWVDSAPWGWAPYHYGRWFQNGGYGWCWWPGSIFSSYLWNPALVGFFGWGGGFGIGWGGLGWIALAPFELFHPWWGHGWGHGWYGRGGYGRGGYGRYGNVMSAYRNAAVRGAAITASGNSFGHGRATYGRATQAQLRNASFQGQLPAPSGASRQFSNRQATPNPRLASAANRQFFNSQRAPQSARGLTAQSGTRQGIGGSVNSNRGFQRAGQAGGFNSAQNARQPATFSRGGVANVPRNQGFGGLNVAPVQQSLHGVPPNMRAQAGTTGTRSNYGAPTQASSGWHRFGEPGSSVNSRSASAPREQSGWHSFGQPQRTASGSFGGTRPGGQGTSAYRNSFGSPNYGGNYQSRPLGPNPAAQRQPQSSPAFRGGYNYGARPNYGSQNFGGMGSYRSAPAAPHFSAPSGARFSAPSMPHSSAPHYSAPSFHGGGGGSPHGGGGGSFHGGGGGSHGGGGGHSSSGGHRSR